VALAGPVQAGESKRGRRGAGRQGSARVKAVDRNVGIGIAVLGAAVLWSARSFPNVPGQKLGAAFLPMLIGAALLLCAVALMLRKPASLETKPAAEAGEEHFGSSALTMGAVILYILVVHVAFYKLLRVPLPWGVLTPFY
jgi:putative tricarboxylic transport membrane protein